MKKLLLLLFMTFLGIVLSACSSNPYEEICVPGQTDGVYICERKFTSYFDTVMSFKIYVSEDDEVDIENIFSEFETLTEKYHQYFDKYNPYDGVNNLYTINNTDGPVTVDQELFDAIVFARDNEDILVSGNDLLFNIALHPVLQVWHEARNSSSCDSFIEIGVDYCPLPSDEALSASYNINPDDILLDSENLTVDFAKDNMGIDLGGFAKGYFSEVVKTYFADLNLNYILNLGNSNVYANGTNLDKQDGKYYIALTRPFAKADESSYYEIIKLSSGLNLVSSGNYQRYFKNLNDFQDDTLYHHIIDPRTNLPGGETTAVTILYDDGAIGDLLSTILFLMDIEGGLEYVNQTEGLEAIWYIDSDNIIKSDNIDDYIYQTNN